MKPLKVGSIEGYVPPAKDEGVSGNGDSMNTMMILAVLLILLAAGASVMMQ